MILYLSKLIFINNSFKDASMYGFSAQNVLYKKKINIGNLITFIFDNKLLLIYLIENKIIISSSTF